MNAWIAVCSQKGGVGKTTLALNLGLALAQLGRPTCIVELDPQQSLGASLLKPHHSLRGLHEVLRGTTELEDVLLQTKTPGLSLLAVGEVDPLESSSFHSLLAQSGVLSGVLEKVATIGSDVVLIDCPSGLGGATVGALSAASHALVPIQAEPLSLRSVQFVLEAMSRVRELQNPDLILLGLVLMMFDREADASMAVARAAWHDFDPTVVLETVVPRNPTYMEASLHGVPVGFMAAGAHPEGRRFHMLAQEVLQRLASPEEEPTHGGPVQTLL